MQPRPASDRLALESLLTVADVHAAALEVLPRGVADFLDGGAGDELTLRANDLAYDAIQLVPRILRDVSTVDLSTTVLGAPVRLPLLLGPAGAHRMFHPDGELGVAKAAAAAGAGMVLSTGASFSLEEVAPEAPDARWFQVYVYRDRSITHELLERARSAGYKAICLTVDVPHHGRRLRNLRNGFKVPAEVPRANFKEATEDVSTRTSDIGSYIRDHYDASLSWRDIEWVASISGLPVVIKGLLHVEDAVLAVKNGAAGAVVSNHGGRQLDGTPTAISMLPAITDAVGSQLELYVDGGIRRGTDIVKAIAMGARAALVARPYLWGLAVAGQDGVRHTIGLLREELELAMGLMGASSLGDLSPASVIATRSAAR